MGFSKKQRAFIDEYVKCWNASEAARKAGYSERSAANIGYENMRKPDIAAEIKRRIDENAMSADEAIHRIGDIARNSIDDIVDIGPDGKPALNLKKAKEKDKLHLIKSIVPTSNGLKVELHDSLKALELIGKHHALFTDNVNNDGEIVFKVVRD